MYVAIYTQMADEVGGRVELEKQLEDWAIQHDLLVLAQNGPGRSDVKWAAADQLAMEMLRRA